MNSSSSIIFGMFDSSALAKSLARKIHAAYGDLCINQFPDHEWYIRFLSDVHKKPVVLVCGLHDPNEKIVALCLAGKTAKELGARSVTAVIPYLAYMRQDNRFHPGEAISSKIIGKLIGSCVDRVITIDPHLHRVNSLSPVYPCRTTVITAMPLMIQQLKKRLPQEDYVLIGPDRESYQWVSKIACGVHREALALNKKRFSSYKVVIDTSPLKAFRNKTIVIVDDVASTAKTLIAVVKAAKRYGARKVYVMVVHPIFAGNAYQHLRRAGVTAVYSCNTIPHATNAMDVSELLCDRL